eukprot:986836_1
MMIYCRYTDLSYAFWLVLGEGAEKGNYGELRKGLFHIFSQFGTILDIVCKKNIKMRGQAFVAFENMDSAIKARREMEQFNFYGKPMAVSYAKSNADVVAKRKGTYVPRKRKASNSETATSKKSRPGSTAVAAPSIAPSVPQALPPNNVLFVQNLPAEATEEMLSVLCRQFPGFREARLIEGKPGIGFISFDSDSCSTTAMHALQGFQISPQHRIIINYAKK